jgi:hypothetical protein
VSPAEIVISLGSNAKLPPAPIETSIAHAGNAKNNVAINVKINFILVYSTTLSIIVVFFESGGLL